MTRKIKAISFDGDMTLWDFNKVMRHSLSLTLMELRRKVSKDYTADLTIDKMIEIRIAVAAELKGKIVNLEEIRFYAFKRTLETIGQPDDALARELNAFYLKHRFEDIELYPDVIPVMDILGQSFSIGLLSNGNGYPDRCGLPDRFQFVVFAQDVGVEKPDAKIFFTACEHAGCEPQELMHIGDSIETDVAGANGIGAVSVWLNRTNQKDHFETFEQVYDDRFPKQYGFLRPYVKKVIYRYLDCGVLHNGFAHVRCDECDLSTCWPFHAREAFLSVLLPEKGG